jgi:hypothetical protein
MRKFCKMLVVSSIISSTVLLQGCISPLEKGQKQELAVYREKGLEVKEKSVVGAGVAGIFPTAGYFYTGHPVLAITTIPLYPLLGFLWMPFDAASAAENQNYYATKNEVERKKRQELAKLDDQYTTKQITEMEYIKKQRAVNEKYSAY